jgi:hypothetical protein
MEVRIVLLYREAKARSSSINTWAVLESRPEVGSYMKYKRNIYEIQLMIHLAQNFYTERNAWHISTLN